MSPQVFLLLQLFCEVFPAMHILSYDLCSQHGGSAALLSLYPPLPASFSVYEGLEKKLSLPMTNEALRMKQGIFYPHNSSVRISEYYVVVRNVQKSTDSECRISS